MLEVQGVASDRNDSFPYSGIRMLGSIQMGIGIIVFVLGVIDLALTISTYSDDLAKYGSDFEIVTAMTVAASPLWCGGWFAVAGSMGTCVSRKRAQALYYFKLAFQVLNLVNAILFGPVCGLLCGFIAYKRHDLDSGDLHWILSAIIAFMALLEIVMAVVGASVTCCCSPLRTTQVHVIVNPPGKPGRSQDLPRSSTEISGSQNTSRGQANNSNGNRSFNDDGDDKDGQRRVPDKVSPGQKTSEDLVKDQPPADAYDGFQDSGGYPRLKKWALPGW